MSLVRQLLLGLVAIAAAIGIWAVYVPSAAPLLERAGIYALLGMEPPETEAAEGAGRGFGGGAAQVVVAAARRGAGECPRLGHRRRAGRPVGHGAVRGNGHDPRDLAIAPGSYVEAGALVAQLDDDAERIALERARLMVADATADLDRLRQLSGSGAVSAVQIRDAELALRTAELEVEQAEFDLQQRRIIAPISGWAGLLEVEQGDRISAQDTIAVITDRSSIQIDFRVPERFIGGAVARHADRGDAARPARRRAGGRDRRARQRRRPRQPHAAGAGPGSTMPTTACAPGRRFRSRCPFPARRLPSVDPLAIQWSGDGSFVWVVRDGEAARVPVDDPPAQQPTACWSRAPSEAGDLVIIEGVQTLRPGAAVEIVAGASARSARRRRADDAPERGREATRMKQTTAETAGRSGTALFVRRPILAFVLSALIVIAGLASLSRRRGARTARTSTGRSSPSPPTSPAPRPKRSTRRSPAGSKARSGRVAGVRSISSNSRFGRSRVTLEFADDADLDVAATDMRDAVARIANALPDGAETPRIVKADADAAAGDAHRRHLAHAQRAGSDAAGGRGDRRTG